MDIFTQAANALTQAGGTYGQAGSIYGAPQMYNPALAGTASTYNPSLAGSPDAISSGISRYMNPYTSSVINDAIQSIQRQTALQQNQNAAGAVNAGAFGGDRHGIVEAMTNSESQRNIGDLSSTLLNQAFGQAAQLSAQDIANMMATGQFNAGVKNQASQFNAAGQNEFALADAAARNRAGEFNIQSELSRAGGLAGLGQLQQGLGTTQFNVGSNITQQQQQQGALQQQLLQQILGLSGGQYNQFMGQPQNMLDMQIAALSGNPMTGATTTTGTTTPGLFDYLGLGLQSYGTYAGLQA